MNRVNRWNNTSFFFLFTKDTSGRIFFDNCSSSFYLDLYILVRVRGCIGPRGHNACNNYDTYSVMEWFRSPPAASPRASTCAHLREGGLGRGRVCSIDRRPSTSITECARTPTAHHTPLISVSRATSLSSLSSLSLLFPPLFLAPTADTYILSLRSSTAIPLSFSSRINYYEPDGRKGRRGVKKRKDI